MVRRLVLALALALIAALPASAKDEACTDGVDCLCDDLAALDATTSANILDCEDFEAPALNDGDTVVYTPLPGYDDTKWGDGWGTAMSGIADDCRNTSLPTGQGVGFRGGEGTHSWTCVDIVQEGACNPTDNGDCTFQGTSSASFLYKPNEETSQGGTWQFSATKKKTVGFTMAIKWTSNYVGPHDDGDGTTVATKTDEFLADANTAAAFCQFGCSVTNAGGSETPFAASVLALAADPTGTVAIGDQAWDGIAGWRYNADENLYQFQTGDWRCLQYKISNIGETNGRIEYWFDGVKIVDISDLYFQFTGGYAATNDGVSVLLWDHYTNGGYGGATKAARIQDNMVFTDGDPVPCSAIGFDGAPADISIGTVTITPDSGSAPLNDVGVYVTYSNNTGAVDLYVDCAGGTSWGSAVVTDDAASPVSISDVCDYPSQVTAPSQITVKIVDSDADEDTGSDALSVTEAAGKWATSVIPYPNNGTIDSPFLSYDSRRIYFSYTPTCFRQLTGGLDCPTGTPFSGAQGGIDLYYVEWNGSAWSVPINLGTNINTNLNEVGPWLSDDELTLIFYRHTSDLVGTRQGMISTRANRDAAWGVPTVLGGDYGSANQTWDRTRSDLAVHEPTGEVFLWEARYVDVSTYAGHLGRGTSTGSYTWNAPSYYNGATWDLDVVNESQPYISRDGLTLLFNRRPVDGSYATQLWRATRASTGVNFTTDPTQITVSGLYAWGEVSADGDEAAFVAQAVDFGQPGYSTHLIRMTGTPASASLGAPTVLNPFSAPTAATFCCRN